jgi:hypothetical protein
MTDSELDEMILSFARPRWRKVAMIFVETLHLCEGRAVRTSDEAIEARIRALVDAGRLESQGNLSRPRHSEVRLPLETK